MFFNKNWNYFLEQIEAHYIFFENSYGLLIFLYRNKQMIQVLDRFIECAVV